MSYFVGVDFGTSGARVAVIDSEQRSLFQQGLAFTDSADQAHCWQATLMRLLLAIPAEYRAAAGAIAINGTSSTVLLCDAVGKPIAPPLLYNDARGAVELATLQALLDPFDLASSQANVLSATSSLVKLLWLSLQPDFAQARYLMHQADWLSYLLHGQPGISDYHNSLKLGYDVQRLEYPVWMATVETLLQERGATISLLPRVLQPGTAIAPLLPTVAAQTGFSTNCLICTGTTDSIAAWLASGANQPGEAVTSLGSTLVLKLLSEIPVESAQHGIYSHRLGDLWLVGGASNTGGAVLKQFFSGAELERLSAQIKAQQPSLLDYYPLTQPGERFPINDPQLLPRLEPRPDNPVEFLHGLLESMARIEATGYELLQNLGAAPLRRVLTAGGGANNLTWSQIRTRRLGVPVSAAAQTEAAYGTALLAWRGSTKRSS